MSKKRRLAREAGDKLRRRARADLEAAAEHAPGPDLALAGSGRERTDRGNGGGDALANDLTAAGERIKRAVETASGAKAGGRPVYSAAKKGDTVP
ncbi:MAG: hypothetical protein ACM3X6_07545 [Patescibacteria group bacterium]